MPRHLRPQCRSTWHLVCLLCFAACSGAMVYGSQPDSDPTSYFYGVRGREPVVASKSDFLVKVRSEPGKPASQRPSWLGAVGVASTRAGAAAGRLSERIQRLDTSLGRRGLHAVHGTASPATFGSRTEVEWSLPVLYRPGSQIPIYLTDEIVMRFDPSVSEATARQTITAAGCQVVRWDARRPNRFVVRVASPATNNPLAVANALHDAPGVLYAHPDFILMRQTCSIDDPLYGQQWNLDGDVTKGASANADINVEGAWAVGPENLGLGDPSIRVAVVDDSVQWDHPDLIANYVTGRNLDVYSGDPAYNDPSPVTYFQVHGTAVSGTIVGSANTLGGRGVAPQCGLIGIKALDASLSAMADAYYFAADPNNDGDCSDGAAVINNSWQLTDGESDPPPDLVAAIDYAATQGRNGKGCVVIFSSANTAHTVNGTSVLAQLDSVVCVGASNSFSQHSEYSNVGPEVSVVAPSSDWSPPDDTRVEAMTITTTDDVGSWGYNGSESPDGDYTNTFGGTSASAPTVAGVCALVLSHNPDLTALQVRELIEHTAVQLDTAHAQIDGISGHSDRFGRGRVDAAGAATAASQGAIWPAPVKNLACTVTDNNLSLSWANPLTDVYSVLIVRANHPFSWRPTDGVPYEVGVSVGAGITVVADAFDVSYGASGLTRDGYFFGVYTRTADYRYGWGQEAHGFVGGAQRFYDDCEGSDPGWTHGGAGDNWMRGIPESYVSGYDNRVRLAGPLRGLRGERAIGGSQCWGTMGGYLDGYQRNADAYLRTPAIDLTGVEGPTYLTFYDWCMLETPYDNCAIKVLDENDVVLGTLASNYGGDYDWTSRAFELTEFTNHRIRIQFELVSDGTLERDGWFIDEISVVTTAPPNLPPIALDGPLTVSRNFAAPATLIASGPEPKDVLTYVITSLPAHGTLWEPGATGAIGSVPYSLAANGQIVWYDPAPGYDGPDAFTFHASDRFSDSNEATVTVTVQKYAPDFDQDGDVDLADFNYFRMCFAGPNRPSLPECDVADIDADSDVDLADFSAFQRCFNGPNAPPTPACVPAP